MNVSKVENQIENNQITFNEEFAQSLIDAKVIPVAYKTPKMVLLGIQKAKELNMPPLAGLANLSIINGIPTPSVHLLVAKARDAGTIFELVKDYEPIYEEVLDKFGNPELVEDPKKPNSFIPKMQKDIITTIRCNKFSNGKWFSSDVSFRLSEAIQMELTSKDNWKKMPRIMMRARAAALAARFSEPGATMGLMSDEEMSSIHNVEYTPSEVAI